MCKFNQLKLIEDEWKWIHLSKCYVVGVCFAGLKNHCFFLVWQCTGDAEYWILNNEKKNRSNETCFTFHIHVKNKIFCAREKTVYQVFRILSIAFIRISLLTVRYPHIAYNHYNTISCFAKEISISLFGSNAQFHILASRIVRMFHIHFVFDMAIKINLYLHQYRIAFVVWCGCCCMPKYECFVKRNRKCWSQRRDENREHWQVADEFKIHFFIHLFYALKIRFWWLQWKVCLSC